MKKYIIDYVSKCFSCKRVKIKYLKPTRALHPLVIPKHKWKSISMDFIIGLPRMYFHNDTIYVVIDRVTKIAHFIHGHITNDATMVAKKLLMEIFRLHGFTNDIVSYRDSKFTSEFQ